MNYLWEWIKIGIFLWFTEGSWFDLMEVTALTDEFFRQEQREKVRGDAIQTAL